MRYWTREEFSLHFDDVSTARLGNGGQRVATLLVYLNKPGEGGGTARSSVTWRPRAGRDSCTLGLGECGN